MRPDHLMSQSHTFSFGRAWLYAGLTVGILDIADAIIFYAFRGVAPYRIFQSVATGFYGRAAFDGGASTTVLGAGLHFFNAFTIALVYLAASRRIRTLRRWPLLWGPLYGLVVFAVMFYVVIPLSAATAAPPTGGVLVNEILIHLVGVGLPVAFFAARLDTPSAAVAADPTDSTDILEPRN